MTDLERAGASGASGAGGGLLGPRRHLGDTRLAAAKGQKLWRWVIDADDRSTAPAATRRVAAAVIDGWGYGDDGERILLVISELVTNAVIHAAGEIVVELRRWGHGVHVAVSDPSPVLPELHPRVRGRAEGIGLMIVDGLSDRWGAVAVPGGGGKTVWAEIYRRDLAAVCTRIARDFEATSPEDLAALLIGAASAFEDAPVQDFVPVFVERRVRARLCH